MGSHNKIDHIFVDKIYSRNKTYIQSYRQFVLFISLFNDYITKHLQPFLYKEEVYKQGEIEYYKN